jgi:hypothetical protein
MSKPEQLDPLSDPSMEAFHRALDGDGADKPADGLDYEMAAVYDACFSTPAGRAVLADMRKKYVEVSRFVPGAGADYGYYREGMAQAVFEIEDYVRMAKGPR